MDIGRYQIYWTKINDGEVIIETVFSTSGNDALREWLSKGNKYYEIRGVFSGGICVVSDKEMKAIIDLFTYMNGE